MNIQAKKSFFSDELNMWFLIGLVYNPKKLNAEAVANLKAKGLIVDTEEKVTDTDKKAE